MFDNIYFIGGIHGSGKGTSSKVLLNNSNLIHLEASKVLKWENISDKNNKVVENLDETQDKLITNLSQIVQKENKYLLDGHYCLINKNNKVERINYQTFEKINPIAFILKIDNPVEIKKRLEIRDGKIYNLDFLINFQNEEIKYAKFLSTTIYKSLFVLNEDENKLIEFINR